MQTARECEVALRRLVFEVVETESIPDMNRLRRILDYYRERGVGTAVDDMGSGFSTLEYVTELRPDYVELDRDLLVQSEASAEAREKLDRIVQVSHGLGSRVIAEGIETEAQLALCRDMNVDFLQGFLFARPACPPPQPLKFA